MGATASETLVWDTTNLWVRDRAEAAGFRSYRCEARRIFFMAHGWTMSDLFPIPEQMALRVERHGQERFFAHDGGTLVELTAEGLEPTSRAIIADLAAADHAVTEHVPLRDAEAKTTHGAVAPERKPASAAPAPVVAGGQRATARDGRAGRGAAHEARRGASERPEDGAHERSTVGRQQRRPAAAPGTSEDPFVETDGRGVQHD